MPRWPKLASKSFIAKLAFRQMYLYLVKYEFAFSISTVVPDMLRPPMLDSVQFCDFCDLVRLEFCLEFSVFK